LTLRDKKSAFAGLGKFLGQFAAEPYAKNPEVKGNDRFFGPMAALIPKLQSHNGWFTPKQVHFALQSWSEALTQENLDEWLSAYGIAETRPKIVALILAGNIPLVGFHDFLCVLMAGHKALVKLSSNDDKLLPFLADYLIFLEPEFGNRIVFTEGKLEDFDAVIATGSNNTSRYFEYYFRDKPSVIRKSRNSAAVLTGNETRAELEALGGDIFRYFGLGCRNVSKLFVPRGYDFKDFFEAMYAHRDIIDYEKYANNYDYNKAVFLMSRFDILDNGFMTLKEDAAYASPISSVFYEYYDSLPSLESKLAEDAEKLQCIVSNTLENSVSFGKTQRPELWDYADNVDTLAFLAALHQPS
jgi:hypothetical protein